MYTTDVISAHARNVDRKTCFDDTNTVHLGRGCNEQMIFTDHLSVSALFLFLILIFPVFKSDHQKKRLFLAHLKRTLSFLFFSSSRLVLMLGY